MQLHVATNAQAHWPGAAGSVCCNGDVAGGCSRPVSLGVRRDMKLHSILLGGTGFLTKPCVSPQVFHGSMRLAGWAEGPLLPEVWSLPGNVANLVASDRGRARIGGQGQTN